MIWTRSHDPRRYAREASRGFRCWDLEISVSDDVWIVRRFGQTLLGSGTQKSRYRLHGLYFLHTSQLKCSRSLSIKDSSMSLNL